MPTQINLSNLLPPIEAEAKATAQPLVDNALQAGKAEVLALQQSAVAGIARGNQVEEDVIESILAELEAPLMNWHIKL